MVSWSGSAAVIPRVRPKEPSVRNFKIGMVAFFPKKTQRGHTSAGNRDKRDHLDAQNPEFAEGNRGLEVMRNSSLCNFS